MEMVSIATKDLTFGDKIGSGGEGSVFKGEWRLVNNYNNRKGAVHRKVAIKKLFRSPDLLELKTLSGLSHPNIINVYGFVEEEHHDLCIIMELCQYCLRGYFERFPSPLSNKHLLRWSLEAALPLEYLREHKILHRDVKPENYVVDSSMVLKLTDFGVARELGCTVSNFTQVGTWRWMAPEVHGVKDKRLLLSPSYDIFGLGLLLWYLVARKMPYTDSLTDFAIAQAIINGERPIIPFECPLKLADLIQKCWSDDRKDRPKISLIIHLIKDMKGSLETTSIHPHLYKWADIAVWPNTRVAVPRMASTKGGGAGAGGRGGIDFMPYYTRSSISSGADINPIAEVADPRMGPTRGGEARARGGGGRVGIDFMPDYMRSDPPHFPQGSGRRSSRKPKKVMTRAWKHDVKNYDTKKPLSEEEAKLVNDKARAIQASFAAQVALAAADNRPPPQPPAAMVNLGNNSQSGMQQTTPGVIPPQGVPPPSHQPMPVRVVPQGGPIVVQTQQNDKARAIQASFAAQVALAAADNRPPPQPPSAKVNLGNNS